jgi:hypothetical protein
MTDGTSRKGLPSTTGLIAGALVAIGILLWMFVSKGLLFVAGLGAFGPGILRELGWLRDHDEFQREAAHRAGYHAYLIGGIAAVAVLALLQWTSNATEAATEWIRFIVVVMWLTWMFSSLLGYWGARKTVVVLLCTVGSFWAVFVVATLIGDFRLPRTTQDVWLTLLGIGAGLMFVGPFFALAWTVGRWPRFTAAALIAVAALLFVVLFRTPPQPLATIVMTRTMLVGPLLATGIALLYDTARGRRAEADWRP